MNVAIVGGGPAGLFLSILLKKARPRWDVAVYEQNPRGNTFGWGIVFSDGTMERLREADAAVADATAGSLAHWDDIEVHFKGRVLRSSGHGFIGVGRHRFIEILTSRAEDVGVQLHFERRVESPEDVAPASLIVAADGVNSLVRTAVEDHFDPTIEPAHNRYTWLGTSRPFPAFSFFFRETPFGWFQAHCYQFSADTSTFIIECREETWHAAGLDRMTKAESLAFCEELFTEALDGHGLLDNAPHLDGPAMWLRFPKVNNARWHTTLPNDTSVVLLGDAAATAHFSIGSGTKLALESAMALAAKLVDAAEDTERRAKSEERRELAPAGAEAGRANDVGPGASSPIAHRSSLELALRTYEEERRVEVLKLQNAARNSTDWFESVALRGDLDPEQFAYSLLTRSQRVSHENLRLRDREWLEGYERWLAERLTGAASGNAVPPMFLPFTLRDVVLPNRVVMSPMAMYSADAGVPDDFHLVHLGQRALGGAGLVFTEMTCVSPDARITPGCAGLWNETQAAAYARIVRFIHDHSPARAALQLGHAGPKGSVKKPWEAPDDYTPLDEDNWPLFGASALPYTSKNQMPRAMTRDDMDAVREDFVAATVRGMEAGFDWLELHCAHGYLLSAFLSPLTNHRDDEYGGPVENRVRYPLEVLEAVRAAWPENLPMSVRISAVDWVDGGNTIDDAVEIARAFAGAGADVIDVSTGQVSVDQAPVYGRMWQTPFAERIRLETDVAVMAVGNLYEPDHLNSIIASGRADLCLLARPHLWNPHWTLFAAADLDYREQWWPSQYLTARRQMERIIERRKAGEQL